MGAPVVRTLVGICELCFQGVMGQVMYAGFARLLLSFISRIFILVFNARLHRASPACGFTIENFMNLFAAPPASFQLGCIFLLSETMVVLLGVFLVKGFPDLVYASIARSRVAAVGMNPSGLQILQKAAQIGVLAALSALLQEQAHGDQQSKRVIDHYNSTFHRGIEAKPLKTIAIVSAPTCVKRKKRWPSAKSNNGGTTLGLRPSLLRSLVLRASVRIATLIFVKI